MKYAVAIAALVLLLGSAWLVVLRAPSPAPEAPQVTEEPQDGWVRSLPSAQGLTFEYPDPFPGNYISASEWPPLVEKVANEYSCAVALGTDGPVPTTEERLIGGRPYCVTETGEGAAGSTYRTFEYSTARADAAVRAVFTLRFPQCGNYDAPRMDACAAEQAQFDADAFAHRLIESVRLP